MSSRIIYLLFLLLSFCFVPYLFSKNDEEVGENDRQFLLNFTSLSFKMLSSDTINNNELDEKNYVSSGTQGKLRCLKSFEPTCYIYPYVRYWNKEFSKKDCYESPLRIHSKLPEDQKYVVFEPDRGAWNNIRMAAEVAIVFAHATGRTLVLPPIEKWYLLSQNSNNNNIDTKEKQKHKLKKFQRKQNNSHNNHGRFDKFFNLTYLKETMDIISMQNFIQNVALKKQLNGPIPYSLKKANFDEYTGNMRIGFLWKYLERACYLREWEPGKYFIGFNLNEPNNSTQTQSTNKNVFKKFSKKNVRHREMVAHGRKMIPYMNGMHEEKAIFFPGDYRTKYRILTHFYTYLYWEQEYREHFYRRFVRDRLRYIDEIFCRAGRIVQRLHQKIAEIMQVPNEVSQNPHTMGGNTSYGVTYMAYHIRRGDFQYKDTRISAEDILNTTNPIMKQYVDRTRIIYIASDERNASFFKPWIDANYRVFTLEDFSDVVEEVDKNYLGMIEQVVCANAHVFFGTYKSTFTGYITRLRGYYRDGRHNRSYYTTTKDTYRLHTQKQIKGPFWAREFESSFIQIDDDYHVK